MSSRLSCSRDSASSKTSSFCPLSLLPPDLLVGVLAWVLDGQDVVFGWTGSLSSDSESSSDSSSTLAWQRQREVLCSEVEWEWDCSSSKRSLSNQFRLKTCSAALVTTSTGKGSCRSYVGSSSMILSSSIFRVEGWIPAQN